MPPSRIDQCIRLAKQAALTAVLGLFCAATAGIASTEAQTGDRSPDIEPFQQFERDNPIFSFGLPVGRLEILYSDGSQFSCTAFIVSELYILTNAHCVPGDFNGSRLVGDFLPSPRADRAALTMGLVSEDGTGSETYDVDIVPAESSRIYDYSVLRVRGNPSRKWGKVALSLEDTVEGQPGLVLHHPIGDPLHVTRRNCFLLDVVPTSNVAELLFDELTTSRSVTIDVRFQTSCSVEPGSSGAPFYARATGNVVGLISSTGGGPRRSRAIPISLIATTSQIVRDLARSQESVAQTGLIERVGSDPITAISGLPRKSFTVDERCDADKPVELQSLAGWTSLCATEISALCVAQTQPDSLGSDVTLSILAESSLSARQALQFGVQSDSSATSGALTIGEDRWELADEDESGALSPLRGTNLFRLIDALLAANRTDTPATISIGDGDPIPLQLNGFDAALTSMLASCGYIS